MAYEEDDEERYEEYDDEPKPVPQSKAKKAAESWGLLKAHITQMQNDDGSIKTKIVAKKTAFVSALIHLDGGNFSFKGREYLDPVYNRNDSEILMKNARQTEKSTYLSNDLVIKSLVKPFNKSLYVSPSHQQTRQFSSEKLKPIIDNSPLIKTYFQDSTVSAQVFEKGFLNGSFIFLRSAYRSADRCLPGDTKILLANGTYKTLKSIKIDDKVLSLKDGKPVINRVTGKENNGPKTVGQISLLTGHCLEATHNHRFLTDTGVKRLDEITENDFIPVPYGFCPSGVGYSVDTWMGLLLSDGCAVKSNGYSRCSFNNNDKGLVDLFEELSHEIGISEIRRNERVSSTGKKNYTASVRTSEESKSILDEWGLDGVRFDTKFIPPKFMENSGSLSLLLQAYFEGNGWVTCNKKTKQCEVGVVTGSEKLAYDLLIGLQSLGIYSILETWAPGRRSNKQKNDFFCIKIRNCQHIKLFSEKVGFINKQPLLDEAISFISSLDVNLSRDVDVPARNDCDISLKKAGISYHRLWEEHGISFRNNKNTGKLISLHKVKAIYKITKDQNLLKWLDPNMKWIPVKSVLLGISNKETYDIEVSPNHLFVANGMYTHNTRGISARNLYLDEIQDLLIDQIPVIRECTSHFPDSLNVFAGTPKSLNNPIEVYWKTTSQNEWLVPCQGCGKWNFLDEKNIAPTEWYVSGKLPPGPVCRYCGKPIDVKKGRWVSMCPGNAMKGYRVPQLMVPWICGLYNQWLKLLWKRDNYPMSQFYNEVLGISYDCAASPITQSELIEICGDYSLWNLDTLTSDQVNFGRGVLLTAGIDWGEGLDGSEKSPSGKLRPASYTVLTIGYYHTNTQYKIVAIKKFTGKEVDPDYVVKYSAQVCKTLGIDLVGVDWGHGWGVNNQLVRLLGGNHVVQFQYLSKLKTKMRWDPMGYRYHLMRNFMMSELFYDMKHGNVLFPKWSEFEPFSKDILAIYTEYNEFRKEMKYDHRVSDPDDFFHSFLFAKLVADIQLGRANRFTSSTIDLEYV